MVNLRDSLWLFLLLSMLSSFFPFTRCNSIGKTNLRPLHWNRIAHTSILIKKHHSSTFQIELVPPVHSDELFSITFSHWSQLNFFFYCRTRTAICASDLDFLSKIYGGNELRNFFLHKILTKLLCALGALYMSQTELCRRSKYQIPKKKSTHTQIAELHRLQWLIRQFRYARLSQFVRTCVCSILSWPLRGRFVSQRWRNSNNILSSQSHWHCHCSHFSDKRKSKSINTMDNECYAADFFLLLLHSIFVCLMVVFYAFSIFFTGFKSVNSFSMQMWISVCT